MPAEHLCHGLCWTLRRFLILEPGEVGIITPTADEEVLPWWLSGKESACQCGRPKFNPWVGKIPWRRKWQPTPVFLPGKSHGQRSLVGYSPQGLRVRYDLVTKQQQMRKLRFRVYPGVQDMPFPRGRMEI